MTVPHTQPRLASFAEAFVNVVAGFVLAVLVQCGAYPLFGITTTIVQNGTLAFLFTALSFVRSYAVRRLFVAMDESRWREREQRAASLERRLATGGLPANRQRGTTPMYSMTSHMSHRSRRSARDGIEAGHEAAKRRNVVVGSAG